MGRSLYRAKIFVGDPATVVQKGYECNLWIPKARISFESSTCE